MREHVPQSLIITSYPRWTIEKSTIVRTDCQDDVNYRNFMKVGKVKQENSNFSLGLNNQSLQIQVKRCSFLAKCTIKYNHK